MTFLYVLIFPALDFGLVDLPAVSRASDGTPMVLNYSRWVTVRGGVRLGLAEVELGNPLTSLPSPSHPPFGEPSKLVRTPRRTVASLALPPLPFFPSPYPSPIGTWVELPRKLGVG